MSYQSACVDAMEALDAGPGAFDAANRDREILQVDVERQRQHPYYSAQLFHGILLSAISAPFQLTQLEALHRTLRSNAAHSRAFLAGWTMHCGYTARRERRNPAR